VHGLVARRGHHESHHAFAVAEIRNRAVGRLRVIERKIEHGDDARLRRKDTFAKPAIVGAAHRHLDLDLGMQAKKQHRRREQAAIVDADCVHPFQRHADVPVLAAGELVVAADVVLAQFMARDPPADVLVSDLAAEHGGAAAALGRFHRLAPDHRTLDELEHLLVGLALIVMRVHIHDEEILIVSLARLLRGMRQVRRRGVVVAGELADFAAQHVHGGCLPDCGPQTMTKTSSPRRMTSNFFNLSRRSPTHSPVLRSYS